MSSKASYTNGLYHLLILALCILSSSAILLFPQHNALLFPEYWYESMIMGSVSFVLSLSMDTMVALKFYVMADFMLSFWVFIRLYLATAVAWVMTCCFSYSIWTVYLEYNHPMPLSLLCGYIQLAVQYITLYLLFPYESCSREDIKKRFRYFFLSRIWIVVIDLQYKGITFLFITLPFGVQWILAFLLPIVREFNYRILELIMCGPGSRNEKSSRTTVFIGINTYHVMYVAIQIGQSSTEVTSYLILAIDFLLNIYGCIVIINMKIAIQPDNPQNLGSVRKKCHQLEQLVLIEILEILVPFAYILTVLIAYYGPNATILGNVQNNYWQYVSISNIGKLIQNVLLISTIDTCSAIISGILLWNYCNINIFHETFKIMKHCWPIIAINVTNYLNYVSIVPLFTVKK